MIAEIIQAYTDNESRGTDTSREAVTSAKRALPPGCKQRQAWIDSNLGANAQPRGPIGLLIQNLAEMAAAITPNLTIHKHKEATVNLATMPYKRISHVAN